MRLETADIQKIIPHRFPFLMIDRILECRPNEKLVAVKNVSINEQYFRGHFPHEQVMPGVLIIEAMAQAGCVYVYYSKNLQGQDLTYYLAKTEARFHHPVIPGDQLVIEVTTVKLLPKAGFVKCKAFVGEKLMAEADIGFGIKASRA
ncbi:MAG: 3-hydroxyacyl-ACP dehydratase FabZ [Candidatus Omnitrophica bacterium]|nr:3-hydroxyacyl-ACP dehydratase FabZ [Candidatus Omnitrophota bacterium]MDE2009799.1 3-hydroxyacyl-ACP dehydratase FabZ [Candidatus Omnitrophota bacterium]MDE2231498.1 3-hydroxyacyl-ACP dehydratase FabZ [Candidatus Omnitrophota bacterium]